MRFDTSANLARRVTGPPPWPALETVPPWLVAVVQKKTTTGSLLLTTGVLIAEDRVLTCAHHGFAPGSYVHLGVNDAGVPNPPFRVTAFYRHASYGPNTKEYDIGLLQLDSAAAAAPIGVAAQRPALGAPVAVYGYGGAGPRAHKADVNVRNLDDAGAWLRQNFPTSDVSATPDKICAGVQGVGIEERDSGAPLVQEQDGNVALVGIASTGSRLAGLDLYIAVTESAVRRWRGPGDPRDFRREWPE